MKILFLDFDGVLNNRQECGNAWKAGEIIHGADIQEYQKRMFVPDKVEHLNYIVKQTMPLMIVISSTWRLTYSLRQLKNLMVCGGFEYPDCVLATTPIHIASKHESIEMWIKAGCLDVATCILDDDYQLDVCPQVKTSFEVGLTKELADEVIAILNQEVFDEG